MAGSYCRYCGRRCFVYRIVPDGPSVGWAGHMATCLDGAANDRSVLGHDHTTAINPMDTASVAASDTTEGTT